MVRAPLACPDKGKDSLQKMGTRKANLEIEIKLRVRDVHALRRRLKQLRARVITRAPTNPTPSMTPPKRIWPAAASSFASA